MDLLRDHMIERVKPFPKKFGGRCISYYGRDKSEYFDPTRRETILCQQSQLYLTEVLVSGPVLWCERVLAAPAYETQMPRTTSRKACVQTVVVIWRMMDIVI